MNTCHFLLHETFKKRWLEFVERHIEHSDALLTQIRKSITSPATGSLIKGLPPELQGKVYKDWVSGGRGFRYFYFHEPSQSVVIPIYLSLEPKIGPDDAWDIQEVADAAMAIVDDFLANNMDRFSKPRLQMEGGT